MPKENRGGRHTQTHLGLSGVTLQKPIERGKETSAWCPGPVARVRHHVSWPPVWHKSRAQACGTRRALRPPFPAQTYVAAAEGFRVPKTARTWHREATELRRLQVQEGDRTQQGPPRASDLGPGRSNGTKASLGDARTDRWCPSAVLTLRHGMTPLWAPRGPPLVTSQFRDCAAWSPGPLS